MKRFLAVLAVLSLSVFSYAQEKAPEKLSSFLASHQIPSTESLIGGWHYQDNFYVFCKESGEVPSKELADRDLALMTVTPSNCELVFLDDKVCTFRVGDKQFKLDWTLNPQTREFKTTLPFFAIKGSLVKYGRDIALVYTKSDLELMMRFLCPAGAQKYVKELSRAMAITDGLTLCIIFRKK